MPDLPEAAIDDAAAALCELHHLDPEHARRLARAALDAAWPHLASAEAEKILAHMEAHEFAARRNRAGLDVAWRRHFRIAAQVASLAFSTEDELKRMAAEAIGRGDAVTCDPPEARGGA